MRWRTAVVVLTLVLGPVLAGCAGAGSEDEGPKESVTAGSSATAGREPSGTATEEPSNSASASPSTATSDPETDPEPGEVSIAFVGDVMLGRSVGERLLAGEDPFAGVAEELAAVDLVVGTLETTVGEGGQPEDKTFTFQAPPEAVDSLLGAGFDLVALANNHSYDYGADGLSGTLDLLDEAELAHVGAGEDAAAARAPAVLSAGGVDTGFLSYVDVPDDWTGYRNRDWEARPDHPGVAWAHADDIAADVAAARDEADHVVVLLHAGVEGSQEPSEVQRAAADAALEAGASAVIGGHPHVLQGYRHEGGRLTAWSLGNFVFDGFGDDPVASQSAILTLHLDEDGITTTEWTPVQIVDGLPVALDPSSPEGAAVLDHLESLPGHR